MSWFQRAIDYVKGADRQPPADDPKTRAAKLLLQRYRALDGVQPGLGELAVKACQKASEENLKAALEAVARTADAARTLLDSPEFRKEVLAKPVLPPFQYALYGAMIRNSHGARGYATPKPPKGLEWFLELLLALPREPDGTLGGWSTEDLVAVLASLKEPPERLVELAFHEPLRCVLWPNRSLAVVAGIGEFVAAHPEPVLRLIRHGEPDERQWVPTMLLALKVPLHPFRDDIVDAALGARSDVRSAFAALLDGLDPAWLREALEARARRSADERVRVAELLWSRYGEDARSFLEEWREREKSDRVRQRLSDLLEAPADEAQLDVPPEADVPVDGAVGPGARLELRRFVEHVDGILRASAQRGGRVPELIGEDGLAELVGHLEGQPWTRRVFPPAYLLTREVRTADALVHHPEFRLGHLVRLLRLYERFADSELWFLISVVAKHPQADLRALARALAAAGLDPELPFESVMLWGPRVLGDLSGDRFLPYFVERLPQLGSALEGNYAGAESWQRPRLLANSLWVLSHLPRIPPLLHRPLFEAGLSGAEPHRTLARRIARDLPDLDERLQRELASTQQARRTGAATWLGEREAPQAVPALQGAARKEGNEFARAAMLTAIERLGGSVAEFVGREALAREAAAGLRKGFPEELAWIPSLPAPRWGEDGTPLEPASVRWLLLRAHRLKAPQPDPLLTRYAGMLTDGERLADVVLQAWLQRAEDPDCPAPSRGLLALVAAFGGPQIARPVREFVYRWYGQKLAQCKTLLELLAASDHGEATQVLLAVADRFQTRGIQEEARRLAQVVAEQRGWTPDQLGDRTCPTAGFSPEGVLRLDFGPRAFEARLDDRLEIGLFDPEGKPIKSLPQPRKDDAAEPAAAARKELSAAKKGLKEVVQGQTQRLAGCMAQGRSWTAEEWNSVLLPHPILGRLAARLLWQVHRPDGTSVVVRPLEDGSLTDAEDEEVLLAPEDRLTLVHETTLTPEESARWMRHLADYKVETLFPQLGRHRVEPQPGQTMLDGFRGHVLGALELRGRAQKLGFGRGPVGEGGGTWFHDYRREYGDLGVRADLVFSGSYIPEDAERKVALHGLVFRRLEGLDEVPLSELPAPLLSESWHQLEWIAAGGSGFDPEWESKVETE